jgi:hypothetical protein
LTVDKVFVAKRVAAKVRSAEHSIDAALIETSELIADMLKARLEVSVAANVGDAAIAKMTAAMTALTEARTLMVAGHAELAEVQLRVGIRTRLDGIENKADDQPSVPSLKVA